MSCYSLSLFIFSYNGRICVVTDFKVTVKYHWLVFISFFFYYNVLDM